MARALLLWTLLALVLSSCNASSHQREGAALRSASLEELDLTSVIDGSKILWTGQDQSHTGPFMNWKIPHQPTAFDSLPKAQKMQLGGWVTPGKAQIEMLATFMDYREYERARGFAPKSAAEIVDRILSNNPKVTYQGLLESKPDTLPGWFYELTNPVTGRLYASFDGSIPEPGGIIIHRLSDAADATRAYAGRPGAELFGQPRFTLGYEVILHDIDPAKVLDTAVVLLDSRQ